MRQIAAKVANFGAGKTLTGLAALTVIALAAAGCGTPARPPARVRVQVLAPPRATPAARSRSWRTRTSAWPTRRRTTPLKSGSS